MGVTQPLGKRKGAKSAKKTQRVHFEFLLAPIFAIFASSRFQHDCGTICLSMSTKTLQPLQPTRSRPFSGRATYFLLE
jgi:hypothetical protein